MIRFTWPDISFGPINLWSMPKEFKMLYWMVIYPRGDRSRLSVAQVRDYEKDEWDLASRQEFPNTEEGERECREYMVTLAKENGKQYDGQRAYLD